ncbi:MAG: zinc-ribbon domain-containing protein [Promethearchaeota archaeon]
MCHGRNWGVIPQESPDFSPKLTFQSRVKKFCPQCGAKILPESKYCPECGSPQ